MAASSSLVLLTVSPNGNFLYLGESGGKIEVSALSASGLPGLPATSATPANGHTNAVAVDPSSRFIFAAGSNNGSDNLASYRTDPGSGVLLNGTSVTLYSAGPANDVGVQGDDDPSGTYNYMATLSAASPLIATYSIDQSTGILSPLGTPTVPLPALTGPTAYIAYVIVPNF